MVGLVLAVAAVVIVVLSGCSTSALPGRVARGFDSAGVHVVNLTDDTDELVADSVLDDAVDRARALGTDLRIVIVGTDDELVDAEAISETYGGTALSYRAMHRAFEAASVDLGRDLLDRATEAAGRASDIGASTDAFVDVLERNGIGSPDRSTGRMIVLVVLALSVAFALSQLIAYLRARKRAQRRRAAFEQRRAVLTDWVRRLATEAEAVEAQAFRLSAADRARADDARRFIDAAGPVLSAADTLGELDASEIRIARTAIKLRDLRHRAGP